MAKEPEFKVTVWVLLKNMKSMIGSYLIQQLGPNFTYTLVDIKTQLPMKDLLNAARLKLYVKPKASIEKTHKGRSICWRQIAGLQC